MRNSVGLVHIIMSLCAFVVVLTSSMLGQAGQTISTIRMWPAAAAALPYDTQQARSPYASKGSSNHAKNYYQFTWGVDSFVAKAVQSGQMIRFGYRVIDPQRAKALNDKKAAPYLIDERAGVKLVVPSMEKVGSLRQSTTPEVGKTYWMLFSNKGGYVKRGSRVSVVIGKFRVDELVVE
jgi:hypothetical protein